MVTNGPAGQKSGSVIKAVLGFAFARLAGLAHSNAMDLARHAAAARRKLQRLIRALRITQEKSQLQDPAAG
jgi:hypothetical protein